MAFTGAMGRAIGKRKSISDQIDRIQDMDDETRAHERFMLMEEMDRDKQAAENFRWHAPKTQSRQDFHLRIYTRYWLEWCLDMRPEEIEEMSEEEKMLRCFPDDEKQLASQLRTFIMYVFKRTTPRSKAADTIQIRSLTKWRDSMIFWTHWFYGKREKDNWNRHMIFNSMTKEMRYVHKTYGKQTEKQPKTWLGLAELRELLDYEATNNRCVELSEQHQVLWCIGRVAALRPGSLCPSGKYSRTRPLTWRSVEFTAGGEAGKFDVSLRVNRLDIKHPEDALVDTSLEDEDITIKMVSPESRNLMFSPAHRLLVIALRRGILAGISTIDELLSYPGRVIPIEKAHLDDYIFYSGSQKGETLNLSKPLMAHALTDYLQLRGKLLGYATLITWYSLRRRAATDMVSKIGMEMTRLFLGHAPQSQVLERHYLNLMHVIGASSELLDEQSKLSSTDWAPLIMNKLDAPAQKLRGDALARMTKRLILADPNPPENPSPAELKNYRRNARRLAEQCLLEAEGDKQRFALTKDQAERRTAGLNASAFADEILKQALAMVELRGIGAGEQGASEEGTDDDDPEGAEFVATAEDDQLPPEEDLEKEINAGAELIRDVSGAIIASVDTEARDVDEEDAAGEVQEVGYKDLAWSMMDLLLRNAVSTHATWSQSVKTCPLCQEDDSVTDEVRAKEYAQKAKLDSHLNGNFHHPVSKWKRCVERDHGQANGRVMCPYCEKCDTEGRRAHRNIMHVIKHVMASSSESDGLQHDEMKAADGWYSEDFEHADDLPASAESIEKHMKRGKQQLQDAGIDVKPVRQLLRPEPYGESPSIVRGSHPSAALPSRYTPFIQSGAQPKQTEIPPHLQDFIQRGYPQSVHPLPDYMRDVVNATRHPRSQEDEDQKTGE